MARRATKGDEDRRRIINARRSRADVWQAILPAGGLSSPPKAGFPARPAARKAGLQPGLAAPQKVFNRAVPSAVPHCPSHRSSEAGLIRSGGVHGAWCQMGLDWPITENAAQKYGDRAVVRF